MADDTTRQGQSYLTPGILTYLARVHAPHDAGLERAYRAHETHGIPAIQLQPTEGRLLELLVHLVGARRVVEIGTLGGYSALRIARALPADGHLWTCELDATHARIARENVAAAGLASRVTVCVGPALETLRALEREGPFCAVFVDADKGNYDHYGRWARANLRRGGILVGDNAAYFGNLLDDRDGAAAAMRRFHEETASEMASVCIPTPDGMLLAIKR